MSFSDAIKVIQHTELRIACVIATCYESTAVGIVKQWNWPINKHIKQMIK